MTTMLSCPGHDALKRFSLGQVRETEASGVEAHLADCPRCVGTLHDLGGEDTLVAAMRAQREMTDRPKIDAAVIQLMLVLKSRNPSESWPADGAACSDDTNGAQELLRLASPPEQPDELGRLGAYRLLKILGAGGMGVVFEAEDPRLQRKVALKAIRPHLAVSGKARKRFLREARAAAAITHDNVITIYEVGEDRGIPFLAMQSLPGETLEARLRREGPLPLADILHIGRRLAAGLNAAHAQGLLHRDVKPGNIFLVNGEAAAVKLLDFGLAWAADESGPLTELGTAVGTPSYMAPEQARGEPADIRSDLFSLGSVLYAMCTGQAPFHADSNFATLERVRTESPRPIAEINPTIPQWLADLVAKLHAKDRANRSTSAAEVGALLQQPARQAAGSRQQATGKTARRWWAAAALLLLPIVGLTLCETTGTTRLREIVASLREQPEIPKIVDNGANPETTHPLKIEVVPTRPLKEAPVEPIKPEPVEKAPTVFPAALFAFEERGPGVRDYGGKVADILFAKLAARPDVYLVDRADLRKTLAELELNISGVVKPGEAIRIGQLTGAKILISGSVIQVDKKIYLVAKMVGTETSRVLAASVDGHATDELAPLVDKLAEQVAETITKQGDKLVAKVPARFHRVAALNARLKGARPTVMVQISERHLSAGSLDPAAQTEIAKYCRETGFTVIDAEEGSRGQADLVISGEAFSEVAARTGRLISVKARVELKVTDRKAGTILVVDRQTALVVDLAEQSAAKAALEEAAALLAERVLPKLVK